jgi:hypothetical protein
VRFDWLAFTATLALTSQTACATAGGVGGLNGPCERENDCLPGLSCMRGVCTAEGGLDQASPTGDAEAPDSGGPG